jgi:membrane-associated phospholipid phosphatase
MLYYGLAGFVLIMAVSFIRGTKDKYEDFCVGAAILLFISGLPLLSLVTNWFRPATIDGSLRAVDLALGLDGFAMTRWLTSHGLRFSLPIVYFSLPLMMALAWALERPRTLLRAAVIGAILAFPIYIVFPAVGPQYIFASWPSAAARLMPAAAIGYPRNCVPSMHFTWALLLALNVHDRRWLWIFALYAALMAFATVAGGAHYFIDVLAAIPFTLAVQKIAQIQRRRSRIPLPAPRSAGVTT